MKNEDGQQRMKKTTVLTRGLKRSVLGCLEKVEVLDDEVQQQLLTLTKPSETLLKSPRLSISQSTQCSKTSKKSGSTVELRKQLESTIWVQCDNLSCHKWRRVTNAEMENVTEDSKWFCSMNFNTEYGSCSVAEEDTEWYDKAAQRVGLKYVKTPITEGSLVWAKMAGYCKWPGIITRDPANGLPVLMDEDREPAWYHVEFLGGSHTHSWIRSQSVNMYTQRRASPKTGHAITKKAKLKGFQAGHRARKQRYLVCTNKTSQRQYYKKGVSISEACVEANQLVPATNEERLKACKFSKLKTEIVVEMPALHLDTRLGEKDLLVRPMQLNCAAQNCAQQQVSGEAQTGNKKHSFRPKTLNRNNKNHPDEPLGSSPGQAEPTALASLKMDFPDSLASHSKEEKLVLDVQMYQRNERAFEHDVLRFMRRNNVTFHGLPKWQNTSVSLFQLFLAVHERGGYDKVCSKRGSWTQVYRELTEFSNNGEVAKKYYKRNLYPYELYIKGKDFESALPIKRRKKTARKREKSRDLMSGDDISVHISDDQFNDVVAPLLEKHLRRESSLIEQEPSLSSEQSVDLMEMLGNLETHGSLCYLEDEVSLGKAKLGIDITFFDESPPRPKRDCQYLKETNTASEFGLANMPGSEGGAQEVPNLSGSSEDSSEHQLLHEMQALQDGIDLIDGEIDIL